MNKTTFFVLGIALLATKTLNAVTISDCQAACVASGQPICSSDGIVYPSSCYAACASKDNYVYFNCGSDSSSVCGTKCQAAVAVDKCIAKCPPQEDNSLLYCGSDGEPYNNLCKVQCKNSAIVQVFVCNSRYLYSKDLCRPKCVRTVGCESSCKNQVSTGYLCTNDGLIYPTQCEVTCNGLQVASNADGNTQSDLDKCFTSAMLVFGFISGTVAPGKTKGQ